jgi:hypothetical protein
MERSPEVFKTLQKLDTTGCDLFVDVHGDEELPHIFLAGEMGVPKWSDRMAELYRLFVTAQLQADPVRGRIFLTSAVCHPIQLMKI